MGLVFGGAPHEIRLVVVVVDGACLCDDLVEEALFVSDLGSEGGSRDWLGQLEGHLAAQSRIGAYGGREHL